jgi:DNA-binding MarR family transcriptional regulator
MDDHIAARLADISRLMRRNFDARARSIGVTRPQWQVLSALRRHEGINQGGLADLLDVEPITVCRMVDRLQEADLVERRADPADRRSWKLFLTDRARALLELLRPLAVDLFEEAFEGLSEADRVQFEAVLDRVRGNLLRPAELVEVARG